MNDLKICYRILEDLQIVKESVNKSVSLKASVFNKKFGKKNNYKVANTSQAQYVVHKNNLITIYLLNI